MCEILANIGLFLIAFVILTLAMWLVLSLYSDWRDRRRRNARNTKRERSE